MDIVTIEGLRFYLAKSRLRLCDLSIDDPVSLIKEKDNDSVACYWRNNKIGHVNYEENNYIDPGSYKINLISSRCLKVEKIVLEA